MICCLCMTWPQVGHSTLSACGSLAWGSRSNAGSSGCDLVSCSRKHANRSARGWSRSITATLESNLSAALNGQKAGKRERTLFATLPIFFLPCRRPQNALNPSASSTQTLIWKRACTYVLVIVLQQSLQMIQDLIVASWLQSWRFELLNQLLEYILVR